MEHFNKHFTSPNDLVIVFHKNKNNIKIVLQFMTVKFAKKSLQILFASLRNSFFKTTRDTFQLDYVSSLTNHLTY